jgi:salicylate hydroxylase
MVHPHEIVLASGGSLRKITHVPCGAFAAERWGAPYGVMHRADLQTLLLDAVNAQPNCHLHLGQRISSTGIGELANRLGLPRPDLVVGADGVWSEIRKLIKGAPSPRFSGQVAWRFKVPTDVARPVLNPASVTAFLGPRTHLVAYPLEKGKTVNMVAITRGNDPGQTWAQREQPDRRQDLLAAFSGWHRDLIAILRQAPEMTRWPLYELPDGPWHDGANTILIGDAAHAMTPFAAQGAAMAIEDGYELAQACNGVEGELAATLQAYQARRRARVSRTRSRGAFNQFAYHARGPIRLGRAGSGSGTAWCARAADCRRTRLGLVLLDDLALVHEDHAVGHLPRAKPMARKTLVGHAEHGHALLGEPTMVSSTSLIISGSSAEVGSSNSMMRGFMHSERAMATRCC